MRTRNWLLVLIGCWGLLAAAPQGPALRRIYFNLYTDSLKPILNYYVNVEGEYSDGTIQPLDSATVSLRANWGVMRGNEWVIPDTLRYDRVTFYVRARRNPALRDSVTIWLQKWKDPRDAPGYEDPDAPVLPGSRRGSR